MTWHVVGAFGTVVVAVLWVVVFGAEAETDRGSEESAV